MRVSRILVAPCMGPNDIRRDGPTPVRMAGLRHNPRHKCSRGPSGSELSSPAPGDDGDVPRGHRELLFIFFGLSGSTTMALLPRSHFPLLYGGRPSCTEREIAHQRVRMEGWRQRRMSSREDHSTIKGNHKTGLTLTGPRLEGLGIKPRKPVLAS
jgi:hypothetical protein